MSSEIFKITTAVSRGEEEAFSEFYAAYSSRMYSYIYAMAEGNGHSANDTFQESMLRVIRYMRPFDDENVFWCWLVRIMRTAFIDQLRKQSADKIMPFPVEELQDSATLVAEEERTRDSMLAHLDNAMCSIAPDERRLIESHYFEDRSQISLAEENQTSPKAIGMKFIRIRAKLKSFIRRRLQHE
jgi:RNA polymerase sigma factor (sigma-70 family)